MKDEGTFLLLDPSVADYTGHHFEYARQVLCAAEQAGYRPALAANRRFALGHDAEYPVHCVYKYGYWSGPLAGAGFAPLRLARRFLRRMLGSGIGDGWKRRIGDPLRAAQFARDTIRLLERLRPSAGDVHFLPTMGAAELAGLARVLRRMPAARGLRWRLVFRRDPPDSRATAALFRQVCAAGSDIRCYTDTEELSRQYATFAGAAFVTLPIPHTAGLSLAEALAERQRYPSQPLRILYLGDARLEKGYQHLPAIIDDLRQTHLATGRVSFTVQSHLAADEPQIGAARRRLAAFPGGAVRLLGDPLCSADYRKLLLSGDIVLLLYDPTAYRWRSSGILVEALAAGVPCIVPADTWLARQLPSSTSSACGVGLAYRDIGEAAGLIRQLVERYDDYRRTAAAFAPGWAERHNAARLIAALVAGPSASTAAEGCAPR